MIEYDLSIIIVNYNAKKFLSNCINSIYKNTKGIKFEVILVDNRSTDDSVNFIKEEFLNMENFIFIENKENLGFAAGNNKAIKMSKGKAVLLLNPDTVINENVIGETYKCLMGDKKVGVAGCKVLNPDGTLQLACRRMIPTPKDAFYKIFGLSKIFKNNKKFSRYNLTYASPDEFIDVDSVSGSYLMMKKEVIEKIGYLDETFFMYGEEMDWCLRARKAGYIVRYCPIGTIIHYKGESSRQLSHKATYEFYRAMWVFYKKNNKRNIFIDPIVWLGVKFLMGLALAKLLILPEKKVGSRG